jgi:hypothetical protein
MKNRYRRDMSAAGRTGTEPDAQDYAVGWLMRTQLGLVPNEPEKQPKDGNAKFYRRVDAAPTKSEPPPQNQPLSDSVGRALKN